MSHPKTEVKESMLSLRKGKVSAKRSNLTVFRRDRIEFFVHESVNDTARFGRIRSPQWLELLEKFINTPGVDGKILLNWLDKIPCLKSNQLYSAEFYRKYCSLKSDSRSCFNNLTFPPHWNVELVRVIRDTEAVLTPIEGDTAANNYVDEPRVNESATTVQLKIIAANDDEMSTKKPKLMTGVYGAGLSRMQEECRTQTGSSEDDAISIDSFDELLLPEIETLAYNDEGVVDVNMFEEIHMSELGDPVEQNDPSIEIDEFKSAESNQLCQIPNRETQCTTEKRLCFNKIRELCGPNDTEALQSVRDLESSVCDMALCLQNVSSYVNYSQDALQHIFSSMNATYEAIPK